MSAAAMTTAAMTTWMAGSQRIRRRWHATEGDRSSESDECFMKHLILLLWLKQKSVCDCDGNAGLPPRVASRADTFACT
jgi:hypothetical protein